MDLEITKSNSTYSLEENGIQITDFIVSSLPILSDYDNVESSDRRIDRGATFGSRTITTPFYFESPSLIDFPKFRDFLFSLVVSKESFYIREKRRETNQSYRFSLMGQEKTIPFEFRSQYANDKRFLVRLQNTFDIEQIYKTGRGSLTFETTELPFAETVDMINETFTGTSFQLNNDGVDIHPFEQELKITIKNINAPNFSLKNLTNGSEFKINSPVSNNQVIILDGPNVTSNGLAYLRETNMNFIELNQGVNLFQTSHNATIEFEYRKYYL